MVRPPLLLQPVVDVLDVAVAVDPRQVALEPERIEALAGTDADMAHDECRIDPLQAADPHLVHARIRRRRRPQPVRPGRVPVRRQRIARQRRRLRLGGLAPAFGAGAEFVEIGRRDARQRGLDVDVAGLEHGARALGVLLGQHADGLAGDRAQGRHVFRFRERRADVDRDHDIGMAGGDDLVDRQVVDQPAIDQEAAPVRYRRQQRRHRHAGPHRGRQFAAAEHELLAGADVGRHDGQRQRQVFDRARAAVGADQGVEEQLDLLSADHAVGRADAVVGDAEFQARVIALRQQALAVIRFRVRGIVVEQVAPVDPGQALAHGGGADAAGPGPGNQRPHAGAGHAIDRHAQAFQHLEHADVGGAARAAAAQHQADAGTACRRGRSGLRRRCGRCGGEQERKQERQRTSEW